MVSTLTTNVVYSLFASAYGGEPPVLSAKLMQTWIAAQEPATVKTKIGLSKLSELVNLVSPIDAESVQNTLDESEVRLRAIAITCNTDVTAELESLASLHGQLAARRRQSPFLARATHLLSAWQMAQDVYRDASLAKALQKEADKTGSPLLATRAGRRQQVAENTHQGLLSSLFQSESA